MAATAAAALPSGHASAGGLAGLVLARVVSGLSQPVLAVLERTLLGPLTLPPAVAAAWGVTRDVGLSLLTAVLLYTVLQAQLGHAGGSPWAAVPRLALAALGVTASLPLVRGLLAAANALTATVVAALPTGSNGLIHTLTAGVAVGLLPGLLDVGLDFVALLLLAGIAALACFYVVRAAEIVLIALMLPIAAALWVVPAAAGIWRALLGELIVSIFVQPAQALVLLVFAAGLTPEPADTSAWLWGLAALVLLFRVRVLLAGAVGRVSRWSGTAGIGWLGGVLPGPVALGGRLLAAGGRLPPLPDD